MIEAIFNIVLVVLGFVVAIAAVVYFIGTFGMQTVGSRGQKRVLNNVRNQDWFDKLEVGQIVNDYRYKLYNGKITEKSSDSVTVKFPKKLPRVYYRKFGDPFKKLLDSFSTKR